MKQPAPIISILYFALAGGCSEAGTEPPAPEPTNAMQVEVERRVEDAVAAGFSGAAFVTHAGELVVAGGYGFADRDHELPNREDTAFDVGSIMKELTAIAIFQLEEDGVLSLSDTLAALLPDVPDDKAEITLLQIVQHRAGFDEYHDTTGDFEPMTRLEARSRILEQELLFEPGSDEAYSNSGYTLLADVIEAASGATFTDFVRENVLGPAGMAHSGFYSDKLWQNVDTAIGYGASSFGDNDPATWPYTWSLMGNGGLVTTVVDLERLVIALWDGTLLGPDALEAMKRDHLSSSAGMLGGETAYGQAGAGDFGLGGALVDAPRTSTRVIVATNTYDAFDIETFAVELATFILESE
jgi:CubicO group peptidase (beta-lactamase class C family)